MQGSRKGARWESGEAANAKGRLGKNRWESMAQKRRRPREYAPAWTPFRFFWKGWPVEAAASIRLCSALRLSAEYIMAEGNENVILCERGIRTFETSMRNTLDLAGVVMLHKMTHLPVVVDPSHACGHAWMVPQLAKAAVAAGADGLMIEVHNNPAKAKCDGAQSLTPDQFDELMGFIRKEVEFFGKKMN